MGLLLCGFVQCCAVNLPDSILHFLESHHVFVLATALDELPHACSLFYKLDSSEACLVFSSSLETRHGYEMSSNPRVAGAVYEETLLVQEIRGVQFSGTILEGASDESHAAYLKTFPEAQKIQAPFWTLRLESVKMIDNRRGFGFKEVWTRA
jgi:uncharacterized protein YhbP (UPF0306 family)